MSKLEETSAEDVKASIRGVVEDLQSLEISDNFVIFKGNLNEGFKCVVNTDFIHLIAIQKLLTKHLAELATEEILTPYSSIFTIKSFLSIQDKKRQEAHSEKGEDNGN
jgi:hypothetical protein